MYSELGHGTAFKVYLPTIAGSTAAEPSGAETQSDSGTETIMVIEDEDGVRSLVAWPWNPADTQSSRRTMLRARLECVQNTKGPFISS